MSIISEQSGEFTIPANIPSGTVQVEVIGTQGSRGVTTYTGESTTTVEQRRIVTTVTTGWDPLAQTFTLTTGRHAAGVDLWFTIKGSSKIVVQIRNTLVGLPNSEVIAQGTIYPEGIKTDGTSTRIFFKRPIWLEANVEYAIVILTDDDTASVSICEVGMYDAINKQYITQQPYQVGVLLSSSNASTWTPHQTMDLTFRLLGCKFTEDNFEYNFGEFDVSNVTDLLMRADVEKVATDTIVEFYITDEEGNTQILTEDMPVALKEDLNGKISVRSKLKGSVNRSPVLFQGVQLFTGKQSITGNYITRSITAGINSTVKVIYNAYIPGNATVKVYYQQPDSTWTLIALSSGTLIGNGVEECTHILYNYHESTVRIKLVLDGSAMYRPSVQNLRVITV